MKKFSLLVMLICLTTQAVYAKKFEQKYEFEPHTCHTEMAAKTFKPPKMKPGVIVAGVLTGLVVIAGVAAMSVSLAKIPKKRMVELIEESYDYYVNDESPGPLLVKLHESVDDISLDDLAAIILTGNQDGSLCDKRTQNMRRLKRHLKKNGKKMVVDLERPDPRNFAEGISADSPNKVIHTPQ